MFKGRIIKYVLVPLFCSLIAIPINASTLSRNSATILIAVAAGYFLCNAKQYFQKKPQNVSASLNAPATREMDLKQVFALQATTFASVAIKKSSENKLVLQTTQSQLDNLKESYDNNELILSGNGFQSTQSFWSWLFRWNVITVASHGSVVINGRSICASNQAAHYTLYLTNPEQLRTISWGGCGTCTVSSAIGDFSSATKISCTGSGNLDIQEVHGSSISLRCTGSADAQVRSCKTSNLETYSSGSGDLSIYCHNTPKIKLKCSGSGDITLKGAAESVNGSASGSGDVNLRSLTVPRSNIHVSKSGSGSITRPW